MHRALLTILAVALPAAGWASTLNYYFAGDPYSVANTPKEERPLFTTGHLVIDAGRLDGDLAGTTLSGIYDTGSTPSDPAVIGFEFSNLRQGLLWNYTIGFNQDRQIDRWEFTHDIIGDWVSITDSDHSSGYVPEPFQGGEAAGELQSLGYRPGTEEFGRLLTEWEWDYYYDWRAEGAGKWFTDAIAFSEQVQENTRLALANPARSFDDIPPYLEPVPGGGPIVGGPGEQPVPVPVPAPVALLLGGIGLLGLTRWRAAAAAA